MDIRKATKQDIATVAKCQVDMARESEGMILDLETVTRGVTALMEDAAKGDYYLAFDNGHLCGMLMITREWSDWRCQWSYWIQSVYTLPAYRRKGVYSALYHYIQDLVRKSDEVCCIRLYADRDNMRARNTYSSLGMTDQHYILYEWMKVPDAFDK